MSSLLQGIRVVESAMLFNGDRLGALLGDLGADVVKVESPGGGDYLRDMLGQVAPHFSPAFLQANRHKRSVTIDLKSVPGKEIFWKLLETADVFVDGNAAGACEKLGIDYAQQRGHNPAIVYCHYSGFGATGPYSSIPTHGQMMDALAAALPVERGPDGIPRRRPPGSTMTSTEYGGEGHATGAAYAAFHVAAALVQRARTSQGCEIDVASADAVIANAWVGATYSVNAARISDRSSIPPDELGPKYGFYETQDARFVLFCCIEAKFWERFCRAAGRDDLCDRIDRSGPVDYGSGDPRLATELAGVFRTRSRQAWVELAAREHLPLGPAHCDPSELLDDPHLAAREIFYEAEHPHAGPFTYIGQPAMVRGDPFRIERHAPKLGEHTDEILGELGYDRAQIAGYRRDGVI
jgi:crotonobetainyl-CoA:carnitine CoA-transferase CaiB-like acyl-CoA transferase